MGRLRIFTLLTAPTLMLTWATAVADEVEVFQNRHIRFKNNVPTNFSESKTIRQLVNPRNFPRTADSYSQTIDLPALSADFPSEALLAYFLRGFFGSWTFMPEAIALRLVKPNLGEFSGEYALRRHFIDVIPCAHKDIALQGTVQGESYWSISSMPRNSVPSLHSSIFGIFRVVDVCIDDPSNNGGGHGFVDLAFGSDESSFAGCHRLTVRKHTSENGSPQATFGLSCVTCNPLANVTLNEGYLKAFHTIYAKLLFSAALSRVKKSTQSSTSGYCDPN